MKEIKLTEDEIRVMETLIDKNKDAEFGWQQATSCFRMATRRLWDELFKLHPDCNKPNTHCSFNIETHIITYSEED